MVPAGMDNFLPSLARFNLVFSYSLPQVFFFIIAHPAYIILRNGHAKASLLIFFCSCKEERKVL